MIKNLIPILFLLFNSIFCAAQEDVSVKDTVNQLPTNPIVFIEGDLGLARGFMLGLNANYQTRNHLITGKYTGMLDKDFRFFFTAGGLANKRNTTNINEFALLYGYRSISGGHSCSFSLGISYAITNVTHGVTGARLDNFDYFGVPFEVTLKTFNKVKRRFGILYGIFPVGKPTAFGRGIGIKLIGNISKRGYIGLGFSGGLGTYKRY